MKCYFLRHGVAFNREDWRGSDFDRPLTDEGRDRMSREAKAISKLQLGLDAIVTSPLVRAQQTAAIVAAELKMSHRLVEDERLDVNFDIARLESLLREYARSDAIMVVGHEPSMSETIGAAVGQANIDLKKGGLALVDFPEPPSPEGELAWLIPPKVLLA
jgi:phosphohistidine phosphatase